MFRRVKDELRTHYGLHSNATDQAATQQRLSIPQPSQGSSDITPGSAGFDALTAGITLTHLTFDTFYSRTYKQFCNLHANEAGTIDPQHGYVVWPVSIAVWALADLALRTRAQPSKEKQDVQTKLMMAFDAMERHWSPEFHGYCAWLWFLGNKDVYYDDNAHAGNALVTAWEATGDQRFLHRAEQIVTGLISRGWDRGERGGPGGVAWHMEKNNSRNACSTLSVAVLACRLALHGVQCEYCTKLAGDCIAFSERYLLARDDGLVIDNIALNESTGAWEPDQQKYTYNTGFGIEAFMLWARLTGREEFADKAEAMALKAVDPESAMFDHAVPDRVRRIWWDNSYFAHHLVEALVLVSKTRPGGRAAAQITVFLVGLGGYCRLYLRDPHDGLYFRNLRLYRIADEQTRKFNNLFGTDQSLEADGEEREAGDGPLERRRLIKTMIANAGMARIFLLISDVESSVPLH